MLREQLKRPGATVNQRLQLADLLVQLGRSSEAVPVFAALAEELAADGFTARAIAALKRVEKLEPGRPDVEARLATLARQGRSMSMLPAATPLPVAPPPPPAFEIGIEEVGLDTLARRRDESVRRALRRAAEAVEPLAPDRAPEPALSETQPPPSPPASDPPASGSVAAESVLFEAPEGGAPAEGTSETEPPCAQGPETPASPGVAKRLRGVFRRFLAALPASPTAPAPPTAETSTDPAEVAGPAAKVDTLAEAPDVSLQEIAAEPEPASEPPEADLPTLDLEDAPTAAPAESEEEDELPTLDLTEDAEEAPEPDGHEPIMAEPVAAEPLAAEPVAVEPMLAEPEAITVSAEPLEAEPESADEDREPPPEAAASPAAGAARPTRTGEIEAFIRMSEDVFQDQVGDLIEEMLGPGADSGADSGLPGVEAAPAPARPVLAGPLFEGLSDDERVALVRGLKLRTFEPGDVVLTEGEAGSSLFLLTAGAVKVFVRNPAGSNILLDDLSEGDFFGEISILSGRPRNATVTAAALCEMLELDQAALAEIELLYPRVSERLAAFSRERATSAEAAALRASRNRPGDPSLESHFDDGRLEPRLRLRLADAFLKAGQEREAAQVLIELADDLVRRGQNEKAVALLKKVEQLQHRPRGPAHRPPSPTPARGKGRLPDPDDRLRDWLIDVVRDTVRRRSAVASRGLDAPAGQALDPETLRDYGRGLVASPLFEGLSEDELLALVQGLQLRMVEPGDIVLTEGEPGQSVFIVATGRVKVFIRNLSGHDVPLRELGEGAFFGEISALSGRSRTASVTAATPSVLLELDQAALQAITGAHPRVQEILETVYIERASDPSAEAIRSQA